MTRLEMHGNCQRGAKPVRRLASVALPRLGPALTRLAVAASMFSMACTISLDNEPTWDLDYVDERGALMSVWGSSPHDIWVVGGQRDEGLILRGDGQNWHRVEVDAPALLWWVYGFSATDVYAVGDDGLILHYDGRAWRRVESGTDQALYGVWGTSGDVWIVGGDPWGEPGDAVVLRGQGGQFGAVDVPVELLPRALYKTYGIDSGEVLFVGTEGTVLRFHAGDWYRDETPTDEPIISLWGRSGTDIYAVGGHANGKLLHYAGDTWTEVPAGAVTPGLAGVFTAPDHPVIAVGQDAYILELAVDGTAFEPKTPMHSAFLELHGVWGDQAGTTYAVGGDLRASSGSMSGVILRRR
jgi:hypothetical protein